MFTLPNYATATHPAQSNWDQAKAQSAVLAVGGFTVVSGCTVAAKTTPAMAVKVASGKIAIGNGGGLVTVSAVASLAITAVTSHDRIDLVTVSPAGTVSVTKGTACSVATWTTSSNATPPEVPTCPATHVPLAAVYVAHATTTIVTGNLEDFRWIGPGEFPLGQSIKYLTTQTVTIGVATTTTTWEIIAVGGGGGASSGATCSTTKWATGGPGGGAGGQAIRQITINGTKTLALTIGGGGSHGASAVANGHTGSQGFSGSKTTVILATVITLKAFGGSLGQIAKAVTSTTPRYGGAPGVTATTVSTLFTPATLSKLPRGTPGVGGGCTGVTGSTHGEGGGAAVGYTGRAGGCGAGMAKNVTSAAHAHGGPVAVTAATGGTSTATNAPANTGQGGDGGGAGSQTHASGKGGNGGSGFVIIRRVG